MKNKTLLGSLLLLLAAMIWGLSFVAQSEGGEIGTFTFNGLRTLLGCIVLLPVIAFQDGKRKKNPDPKAKAQMKWPWLGGLCCGLFLFVGSNLQQHAFSFSPVGKVGFLTALYMLLVPLFGIFAHKKVGLQTWVAVCIGVFGLFLLCFKQDFSMEKKDFITLGGAFAFAGHIICVDHFAQKSDGVKLSCLQFLFSGVFSMIGMLIIEGAPQWAAIQQVMIPLLYAGIFSCGVAFTIQIIGQQYTPPAIASILLCTESVFAVFFGWLILHQKLSSREMLGCCVMFAAILLSQVPIKRKTTKDNV